MIKMDNLHKPWTPHWQALKPNVIFHMISETLFPRKMVTLGSLLFLSVFCLLMLMIEGTIQASFSLLFLALLATVAAACLWLIGYTTVVRNTRA